MKFSFVKRDKANLIDKLGAINLGKLMTFLASLKDGEKMELIIRKKVSWDTEQMKKFFEGPVVDFVQAQYADKGMAFSTSAVREGLLGKFLGWTEVNAFGQRYALSRTTLDEPKSGKSSRERWIKFLKDIDNSCMDTFGYGLPSADDTDEGD